MITHRTNLLLDKETKEILDFLVKKKKKTVGAIFRDFLLKEGKKHKMGNSIESLIKEMKKNASKVNSKDIDYREMINYGRKHV